MIEKLLRDVLSDVQFLWKDFQLRKIVDALGPENISFIKETGRFFLGNWAKIYEKAQSEAGDLPFTMDLASEIGGLRSLIGKMLRLDLQNLPSLEALQVKEEVIQHSLPKKSEQSISKSEEVKNSVKFCLREKSLI